MKECILCFLMGIATALCAQSGTTPISRVKGPNGGWLIQTRSSAYRLLVTTDKRVYPVFYGPVARAADPEKTSVGMKRIEEVPVRGGSSNKTAVLEVVFADHVRAVDLEYVEGAVVTVNGRPALKITQKDRKYPLEVITYIRILEELDILEKWIEVKHTGSKGTMRIQNLMSGSIALPTDQYVLTQLSGNELGEFQPYRSVLTPGLKVIENRMFRSNNNMPWFLVRPKRTATDENGPAWWGCIHYSGNWKIVFDQAYERSSNYTLQVSAGINFWDTELVLKPGGQFKTPVFSVGYTNGGAEGAARSNAAYVRNAVLPAAFRNVLRPVLFNGWVTTTFHINDSIELAMAKEAAKLGVELFAIDDGWFKGRNSGGEGLGDWEVDKNKFPRGLGPLIDSVHRLGMKFGLWVEPESAVRNSDVYRKHPDWVLEFPGRSATPGRFFLNLAKEEVYRYLYHSLDRLLTENKIDFIKWDQNTAIGDAGWADAPPEIQMEVRVRFINNVYRLVDALRKKHPHVLFESCASGGGRVDLGMLARMDQVWTSDNTTAIDRVFIQYGYLGAMPANTMESWVIGDYINQGNGLPSLSYKFDVAMSGLLGIGENILKWTPEEKALAKHKVEIYKLIRPAVQNGTLYRLVSPFENNRSALQYAKGDTSVLFCYNLALYVTANYDRSVDLTGGAQQLDQGSTQLKLKGLDPAGQYRISVAGNAAAKVPVYNGDYLMNVGISWPLKRPFESQIFLIHKISNK
ncbi:alpha-galactosidase [Niabella aurantiaca]|uniref:alpha-galactosidase n=1 Tax=Niabella aurantiaca TaxID=379900 RepID=UPI000476E1B4|nr:alpha-galactosidase [Niabella aurantiaca]